jgi:hypothetical protein
VGVEENEQENVFVVVTENDGEYDGESECEWEKVVEHEDEVENDALQVCVCETLAELDVVVELEIDAVERDEDGVKLNVTVWLNVEETLIDDVTESDIENVDECDELLEPDRLGERLCVTDGVFE